MALKLIYERLCSLQEMHKKKIQETQFSMCASEVCVLNSWLCVLVPSRLQLL